jgi:hypothetical protein
MFAIYKLEDGDLLYIAEETSDFSPEEYGLATVPCDPLSWRDTHMWNNHTRSFEPLPSED